MLVKNTAFTLVPDRTTVIKGTLRQHYRLTKNHKCIANIHIGQRWITEHYNWTLREYEPIVGTIAEIDRITGTITMHDNYRLLPIDEFVETFIGS